MLTIHHHHQGSPPSPATVAVNVEDDELELGNSPLEYHPSPFRLPERSHSESTNNKAKHPQRTVPVTASLEEDPDCALQQEVPQMRPLKRMDSLPTAPWRRQSIEDKKAAQAAALVEEDEEPQEAHPTNEPVKRKGRLPKLTLTRGSSDDTIPRKAVRKPSNDKKENKGALSFRLPVRKPSNDHNDAANKETAKSFRMPPRMPSRSSSQDDSTASRSLRFLSFRRNQTNSSNSTGNKVAGCGHHHDEQDKNNHGSHHHEPEDDDHTRLVITGKSQRRIFSKREFSTAELGSTEAMTEKDEDADYILDQLTPNMLSKLDLLEDSTNSTPLSAQNKKDRQASLHLHQIFGGGSSRRGMNSFRRQFSGWGTSSRRGGIGHHNNGHNNNNSGGSRASFFSSISSAFSSVRGVFVFTMSNSDRNLAEMDGNSVPILVDDDNVSRYHNYHEDDDIQDYYCRCGEGQNKEGQEEEECAAHPPQMPWRRLSLTSSSRGSKNGFHPPQQPWRRNSLASSSQRSNGFPPQQPWRRNSLTSSSQRSGGFSGSPGTSSRSTGAGQFDGVPRPPGRRSSLVGATVDCIAEVDNEVDASASFHVDDDDEFSKDSESAAPFDFQRSRRSLQHLEDVRIDESSVYEESSGSNRRFHSSAPMPDFDSLSDDQSSSAKSSRRQSAPARPMRMSEEDVMSTGESRFRSNSNKSIMSEETELPFPVRRESIQTVQTAASGASSACRRRSFSATKAPSSVPPEATTLEKKAFLKKTLHFPKQRLGQVLRRVSGIGKRRSSTSSRSHRS